MPPVSVTPIYTALLAFILIALSLRVIGSRIHERVSLGDNDSKQLRKRIRAQGNFVEYVPIGLFLMLLLELQGLHQTWLHLLGATLLVGRILHAVGVSSTPSRFLLRRIGALLTFIQLFAAAVLALFPGVFL